jgi:hypothetical protein
VVVVQVMVSPTPLQLDIIGKTQVWTSCCSSKTNYRVQHPARYVSRLQTSPSSDIELEFTHDRPSGSQVGRGFQTGNDIEEIANRINKLSQIYDEFYTLQCRIEFLESEDPRITSSADQAMEFEKHYFRVLSQLQVLSKKFEKNKPQVQI